MADVADVVPPAIDQSGNTVIWWIPASPGITALNAVKAATELGAATTYRITHSFTPDGFPVDSTQAVNDDPRLASLTVPQSLGAVSVVMGDLQYVDSSAAGSAAVVLATQTGISGFFVVRPNVPNTTIAAAAQKGTVYPVTLGPQRRGPVNGQGKFTWKQQAVITGSPVETTFAA